MNPESDSEPSHADLSNTPAAVDSAGTAPDVSPDQRRTPFLDNVLRENQINPLSFHMPGHKAHMTPHPGLVEYWGGNLYPADHVEIGGWLDYLHAPKRSLREAQTLAALAYGADHTFFLINGSTVGNIGALMAGSHDGTKVIVPRASHRSIYAGLALSGATPIWIEPIPHPEVGFSLATHPQTIKRLLEENPDVTAVHITSPNYYGLISDVESIATIAHEHNALLVVDAAHGPHLGFHDGLPTSPLHLGADMVVMSTHKTLSALTQCSMLHVKGDRVDRPRLAHLLAMLQSSSPSSILLASLDVARMEIAIHGHDLLDRALTVSQKARAAIRAIHGLWCYGEELVGQDGIFAYDPTKLVIRVTGTGMTGFQVSRRLRLEHAIDVELADLRNIICSVTIADTDETIERLITALSSIASSSATVDIESGFTAETIDFPSRVPQAVMSLRQATYAPSRRVNLADCLGEVCAESVIPYPPGIPLILPGEMIEQEHLAFLHYASSRGMNIVGPEDMTLETIRVVEGDAATRAS